MATPIRETEQPGDAVEALTAKAIDLKLAAFESTDQDAARAYCKGREDYRGNQQGQGRADSSGNGAMVGPATTSGGGMSSKIYLGDSVYVDSDGYGVTLTTENGDGPSNAIYLEPSVYEALTRYVQKLLAKAE